MHLRSLSPLLFASLLNCGGASTPPKPMMGTADEQAPISEDPTATTTTDSATSPADASKTYAIHLHRAEHVGDRARIVVDAVEDADMTFHITSRRNQVAHKRLTFHFHVDGVWATTAIDANGDELSGTFDVTKLTQNDAVLLQNKRIDVTKGATKEGATLNVDGKPIAAKTRKALEELLIFRIDAASRVDAVFGSAQPRHVGSHWPIDGDRERENLLADTGISSTTVSGEVTLLGVEHVGDADVARIEADLQIDGMVYPLKQPGAYYEPRPGKSVMTVRFPLGEAIAPADSHTSFSTLARIHVSRPQGTVDGDVDLVGERDAHVTPL